MNHKSDPLARYRLEAPDRKFDLAAIDPRDTPFSSGDKVRDTAAVEALALELDGLQNLFRADRRYKMLVVLQGSDTSGKDGTLRHVFSRMTPLGVHTVSWKAPSEEERDHDPLWRIHHRVPGNGELVVFNRSHYEDVLVPVAEGTITAAQARLRREHIHDFERMLAENATVICKFMLHISKEEQLERLRRRLEDPAKRWKFDPRDLEVRRRWDVYQAAYTAAIRVTAAPWAPWIIVPADSKTHRNLMIATVLRDTFKRLDLRYPPGDPKLDQIRLE